MHTGTWYAWKYVSRETNESVAIWLKHTVITRRYDSGAEDEVQRDHGQQHRRVVQKNMATFEARRKNSIADRHLAIGERYGIGDTNYVSSGMGWHSAERRTGVSRRQPYDLAPDAAEQPIAVKGKGGLCWSVDISSRLHRFCISKFPIT